MIRKHVTYSGRVQGVGFRYTARQIAEGFAVAGHVRNLPSGQVELAAEGTADQVEGFLQAIAARMKGYITEAKAHDAEPTGTAGFEIRY